MRIETVTSTGHLLVRIARDPKLAYYFDPATTSMELLTADYAATNSLEVEAFRAEYYALLKFERPEVSA